MITDTLAKQILDSIAETGTADPQNANVKSRIVLTGNPELVLIGSIGRLKIRPVFIDRFDMILRSPFGDLFNPGQIRCCACKRVIHYPAWHYVERRLVNELHYFICYDVNSPTKPTVNCKTTK